MKFKLNILSNATLMLENVFNVFSALNLVTPPLDLNYELYELRNQIEGEKERFGMKIRHEN